MSLPYVEIFVQKPEDEYDKVLEVSQYDDTHINVSNSCCTCTISMGREQTIDLIKALIEHFEIREMDVF